LSASAVTEDEIKNNKGCISKEQALKYLNLSDKLKTLKEKFINAACAKAISLIQTTFCAPVIN